MSRLNGNETKNTNSQETLPPQTGRAKQQDCLWSLEKHGHLPTPVAKLYKKSSHHQKNAQDQYPECSWVRTSSRTNTAKKSLYCVPCIVDLRKSCRMHKIKEATEPPLFTFCQQQLTECLAVTLDINQSSDLVQWSEREQLQNSETAVWSALIPVPICKMPWVMSRKHKTLPSLTGHRWKACAQRKARTTFIPHFAHLVPPSHQPAHTQLCLLVTVQIPSNNLHLAQAEVVVEGWRMKREGGISWGSSWLPGGPQNCRIIGMQRWMWHRPQCTEGGRTGVVSFKKPQSLVARLWCRSWKVPGRELRYRLPPRAGTRLCVLEVNLASFLAYISPCSALWDVM